MYSMVCWSPRFGKKEPETEKGMEGVKSALRHVLTFFCVCFLGVGLVVWFVVFVEKAKCRDKKLRKLKVSKEYVCFSFNLLGKLNDIDRSKSSLSHQNVPGKDDFAMMTYCL